MDTTAAASGVPYILGHSDPELERLERQAALYAEETENVLRRAGLTAGMRVLDVGCGVGDVSLIAARMVGPEGAVLGVDRAREAVATATRRAAANQMGHVSFEAGDLAERQFDGDFDAVIGRFILVHMPDPASALRRLLGAVRPGGIVAFLEMDIGSAEVVPEFPPISRCVEWILAAYRRLGLNPDMGSGLNAAFRAAGLDARMTGTFRVEAGPDASAYDYLAQSLRSLAPSLVALGIATPEELELDTLADRLRDGAVAGGHVILLPRLIGAWAST